MTFTSERVSESG